MWSFFRLSLSSSLLTTNNIYTHQSMCLVLCVCWPFWGFEFYDIYVCWCVHRYKSRLSLWECVLFCLLSAHLFNIEYFIFNLAFATLPQTLCECWSSCSMLVFIRWHGIGCYAQLLIKTERSQTVSFFYKHCSLRLMRITCCTRVNLCHWCEFEWLAYLWYY